MMNTSKGFGAALATLALSGAHLLATPQAQSDQSAGKRPKIHQSVTVAAMLSPQDVEDGKINDVYQPIYNLQQQHDCSTAINKYQTVVIPLAQKSTFKVSRAKFLFLSYRGMGECYLSEKSFVAAEGAFSKSLEYLPTWPGVDDSDYPITYELIGEARMGASRWGIAQQALQESLELYASQIDSANTKKWIEQRDHLRISRLTTEDLLAVVLFRQGRAQEALNALEDAYSQAIEYGAPVNITRVIAQNGKGIADSIGDAGLSAHWGSRVK